MGGVMEENSAYRLHGQDLPTDPVEYSRLVREIAEARREREAEFWKLIGETAMMPGDDPGDSSDYLDVA